MTKKTKIKLVRDWRKRLKRSFTVWLAAFGVAAPTILQKIADATGELPWLDDGWKSIIRLVCLALIPVVLIIQQDSLTPPSTSEGGK